jgi:methylthioribose-1-phosphate isomerase
MKQSRPTAVDLSNAIELLKKITDDAAATTTKETQESACADIREAYIVAAEKIFKDDLHTNLAIGINGAEYLRRLQPPLDTPVEGVDEMLYFTTSPPGTQGAPDRTYRKISVLTHCNTGYCSYPITFLSCITSLSSYPPLGLWPHLGTAPPWASSAACTK